MRNINWCRCVKRAVLLKAIITVSLGAFWLAPAVGPVAGFAGSLIWLWVEID